MRCATWAFAFVVLSLKGCTSAGVSTSVMPNEDLFWEQRQLLQEKAPIRVFVLVGQSNIVGHGVLSSIDEATGKQKNATLEWLVNNVPDRFGMLKEEEDASIDKSIDINDASGGLRGATDDKHREINTLQFTNEEKTTKWKTRQDVLIACNSRNINDVTPRVTTHGNLYAGLCAGDPGQENQQLGPELGFGWTVGDSFRGASSSLFPSEDETSTLLLKIAWGGKTLAGDIRPPSSGGRVGPFYESMIANVNNTLMDIHNIFPQERGRQFTLSGFAWHQGWNDGCNDTMAKEYESNLANLIRDVRKDLNVPNLPFAIATTGMVGYTQQPNRREEVIDAELNVAKYPEFEGNVISIDTRPFARGPAPASPTDFSYHWNSNAESYWLIGQSLGEAMVKLVDRYERRSQISLRLINSVA